MTFRAEPRTARAPERRATLTPVPSAPDQRAFERFLASWLAEAAERRIRRQAER